MKRGLKKNVGCERWALNHDSMKRGLKAIYTALFIAYRLDEKRIERL